MPRNRLANEASPYLLQHRDNPVNWWPWGPPALQAAQAENKPILLSVGYAACHWCHVMAHESFEDAGVAAKMNARFINIKVDREERPDIDHIYQTALAALGQQGGWPLTMFLTPEGAPFWGGTYFPKEARYGRPAFADILDRLADAYQAQEDAVLQNRDALLGAVKTLTEQARPGMISVELLDPMARRLLQHMDPKHGGLSGAPKFPQTGIFELLWRAYWRTGDETYKAAFAHTLTHIAQGGIYDHLGGGFARYSVDDIWLAPHFEKMLYDNAQLIDLYAQAWADTADPLFAARVAETIAWFQREMLADGGFTASLDADSEGDEGKFYVWDKAEVDALLGPDSDFFRRHYDISEPGNWEGRNIPNRLRQLERLSEEDEARLKACREKLLAARESRVRPGWDDKVLADWSGLMIAALVRAAMIFDRHDWLDLAKIGYQFALRNMMLGDGRLAHSFRQGRRGPMGLLEDYASMALAALKLYMATGDRPYLDQAINWAAHMERYFADPAGGGYFQTASDAEKLIARPKPAADQATPSGNGLSAKLLALLHHLTGDPAWAEKAERLFGAFGGEMERNFLSCATLLHAFENAAHPVEILIHGEVSADLIRSVWRNAPPSAVIQRTNKTIKLPKDHPAAHIDPAAPPAIYICEDRVCSLPLRTEEEIAGRLQAVKGWVLKQA